MNIPWHAVARQAAKGLVWLAARAGKSARELVAEAAGEGAKELEGHRPEKPPRVMRFPPQ